MPAKNILNEETWGKVKKEERKGNEKNYDMISHIYQKMGGTYSQKTVKATMKLRDLLKAGGHDMTEIDKLRDLLKAKSGSQDSGKDTDKSDKKIDPEISTEVRGSVESLPLKKAAPIEPWRLNLMKVDNR